MNYLNETDKAYIAGLFDGEGSIGFYYKTGPKSFVAQCVIYNTNQEVLLWIKEVTGIGGIYLNKRGKHTGFMWHITGKLQIIQFLKALTPYLKIKKSQAVLLLSHFDAEQETRGRRIRMVPTEISVKHSLINELKKLKTAHFISTEVS